MFEVCKNNEEHQRTSNRKPSIFCLKSLPLIVYLRQELLEFLSMKVDHFPWKEKQNEEETPTSWFPDMTFTFSWSLISTQTAGLLVRLSVLGRHWLFSRTCFVHLFRVKPHVEEKRGKFSRFFSRIRAAGISILIYFPLNLTNFSDSLDYQLSSNQTRMSNTLDFPFSQLEGLSKDLRKNSTSSDPLDSGFDETSHAISKYQMRWWKKGRWTKDWLSIWVKD